MIGPDRERGRTATRQGGRKHSKTVGRSVARSRAREFKANGLEFHHIKNWKANRDITFIQKDRQWTLHKVHDIFDHIKAKNPGEGRELEKATDRAAAKGKFASNKDLETTLREITIKDIQEGRVSTQEILEFIKESEAMDPSPPEDQMEDSITLATVPQHIPDQLEDSITLATVPQYTPGTPVYGFDHTRHHGAIPGTPPYGDTDSEESNRVNGKHEIPGTPPYGDTDSEGSNRTVIPATINPGTEPGYTPPPEEDNLRAREWYRRQEEARSDMEVLMSNLHQSIIDRMETRLDDLERSIDIKIQTCREEITRTIVNASEGKTEKNKRKEWESSINETLGRMCHMMTEIRWQSGVITPGRIELHPDHNLGELVPRRVGGHPAKRPNPAAMQQKGAGTAQDPTNIDTTPTPDPHHRAETHTANKPKQHKGAGTAQDPLNIDTTQTPAPTDRMEGTEYQCTKLRHSFHAPKEQSDQTWTSQDIVNTPPRDRQDWSGHRTPPSPWNIP
ncbi:hypothetical protein BDZ91DRAFT_807936 [Kalaharituber pfeilii]|nr:hypothetical protein BDZ91DRAFT_807936 [Kalaharituber pfeilii]